MDINRSGKIRRWLQCCLVLFGFLGSGCGFNDASCGAKNKSTGGGNGKPLACDLGVFTPAERRAHIRLAEEVVSGKAQAVQELKNGFVFLYPPDPGIFTALSRFVLEERRCCPFFDFNLEFSSMGGVRLYWTGGKSAKAFLTVELSQLPGLHLKRTPAY